MVGLRVLDVLNATALVSEQFEYNPVGRSDGKFPGGWPSALCFPAVNDPRFEPSLMGGDGKDAMCDSYCSEDMGLPKFKNRQFGEYWTPYLCCFWQCNMCLNDADFRNAGKCKNQLCGDYCHNDDGSFNKDHCMEVRTPWCWGKDTCLSGKTCDALPTSAPDTCYCTNDGNQMRCSETGVSNCAAGEACTVGWPPVAAAQKSSLCT